MNSDCVCDLKLKLSIVNSGHIIVNIDANRTDSYVNSELSEIIYYK